ncbi:MAG TPA: NlpC/P60 family protein [Micromonosporaceae bacterium]|nr:NlpC/P60 family protein [Micromonosporaceae bacterium]
MPCARRLLRAAIVVGVATGLSAVALPASAEPSVAEVQQRIEKASIDLEKVVEDYNRTNEYLKASRAAAAEVTARLEPLVAELDAAQAAVGDLAARAYKTGEMSALSALLDSGSTGALVDRLAVLDEVSRAQQHEVTRVAAVRTKVDEEKRRLDTLVTQQSTHQRDLAAKKVKIEKDLRALYDLRRQAYGAEQEARAAAVATSRSTTAAAPPRSAPSAPAVSGAAGIAVRYAYGALGKPYIWAADGPEGYDCSGLTMAAWRAAGVSLPHNAAMQWDVVARISRSQLQPGDLVFYYDLGHVGIYVGGGRLIHAPSFGRVVELVDVDRSTPYGYGRVR